MIHEGDEVKYKTFGATKVITTLGVEEGWAYINFEETFHLTVTSFVKKKLNVSDTSAVKYYNKYKISKYCEFRFRILQELIN
jgi:hypothetical protein